MICDDVDVRLRGGLRCALLTTRQGSDIAASFSAVHGIEISLSGVDLLQGWTLPFERRSDRQDVFVFGGSSPVYR